jgi:ubiquinone/menaquinone biosynthesis C-methylase UbiE
MVEYLRIYAWEVLTVSGYIHGYSERETVRLKDQAETLAGLLHHDTTFPPGSLVLEAGCGTGAQTVFIAGQSPGARITAIDISEDSLVHAQARLLQAGITNVEFRQEDVFSLPFEKGSFDHVFVCFVLEHLAKPVDALVNLRQFIKPGGTVTVIEGDHGSAYFYPDSEAAKKAIACQIELQARSGGNALIGRELYPLLQRAGFENVRVSPRMVYVDAGKPELVEGFTKNTFTAMIEGVRDKALRAGMIDQDIFDKGVRDLYRTAEPDGVFCYTFFKAFGEAG